MKLTENCNYTLELNKDEYNFIRDAINEKLSKLEENSNDPAFDELIRSNFKRAFQNFKYLKDFLA